MIQLAENSPVFSYKALPHQFKALTSTKKYTALFGGVGCGKTDVGTLFILKKLQSSEPGLLRLIAANSYTQLFDATLRNFYRRASQYNFRIDPSELPRKPTPFSIRIHNGRGWIEILCRSLESFELMSGIEIADGWLDEVWQTKEEAWNLIQARLRDTRNNNLQLLLTSTTDYPGSWIYNTFVENFDPALMEVITATSYDNPHLPPGYIEGLKATYSEAMFKRMVLALWVHLSGQSIYGSFARGWNIDASVSFDPALPLRWSHDFNIGDGKPMSSILSQIKKGPGIDGRVRPELHIFDEIILETADTNDAVEEFKARDWWTQNKPSVIVYGDASGRAKDTRSKVTDYQILSNAGFKSQIVPRANPPVRDRHNMVNSLLKAANGDVRLKVHPRCKTLIKGLETTRLKKGAGYLEDDSTYEQHVTTALGYLACAEFTLDRPRGDSGPKYWK